jgi:hypothetical protein
MKRDLPKGIKKDEPQPLLAINRLSLHLTGVTIKELDAFLSHKIAG